MRAWTPEPGESPKAYQAFAIYRDLGPSRSIDRAYEVYSGQQGSKKRASGRFTKWSTDHDWVERAREFDMRDEEIRREAVELHALNRAADRAKRMEALREENLSNEERAARVEKKFIERAEKLIDELPLIRQVTVREASPEDGKPAIYQIEPATKNAVLDAARLHKIATRSEPPKVDMRTYDLTRATEAQLQRIADGEDPARVLGEPFGE